MFAMLFVIKVHDKAMINLAQPCHVFLLLQGWALLTNKPAGVIVTAMMLPPLAGALTALLMPAVDGLSEIEVINFWVQHVLLGAVPLYLLCRRNFAALKVCNGPLFGVGLWFFALLHFTAYEVVDVSFNVNAQFMLCPTFGLRGALNALPPAFLYPSYRTTVTVIFSAMALANAYIYFGMGSLVRLLYMWVFESRDKTSSSSPREINFKSE
jgi:hypothetical protein